MCRWFAYISVDEHCLLEDALITPAHSLSKQCNQRYLPGLVHGNTEEDYDISPQEVRDRNSANNNDGLGVAWYTWVRSDYGEASGPCPVVYRTLSDPTKDPNFMSICASTSTLALFGHIRAASPGSRVTESNTHPFPFGRWLFMHNGGVSHFAKCPPFKKAMIHAISDEALADVWGTTDSEYMAALFFTHLSKISEETGGPGGAAAWDVSRPLELVKRALENTLTQIFELQKQTVKPVDQIEPSGLNIAITDGSQMLAIRFRNHPTEQPASLYMSTTAGITLNRKYPDHPDGDHATHRPGTSPDDLKGPHEHGDHLIIASEPTTYKEGEWHLIPKNECVMIDHKGNVQRAPVDVQF